MNGLQAKRRDPEIAGVALEAPVFQQLPCNTSEAKVQ